MIMTKEPFSNINISLTINDDDDDDNDHDDDDDDDDDEIMAAWYPCFVDVFDIP